MIVVGASAGAYFILNKFRPEILADKMSYAGDVLGVITRSQNFDEIKNTTQNESVQEALVLSSAQMSVLKDRGLEVKDELTKAVSEVKKDNQTPMHEKAFEYGQYLYCQQVVEEYEMRN